MTRSNAPSFIVAPPVVAPLRSQTTSFKIRGSFVINQLIHRPRFITRPIKSRPILSVAAPSTHIITVIVPDAAKLSPLNPLVTTEVNKSNGAVTQWRSLSANAAEAHVNLQNPSEEGALANSLRHLSDSRLVDISLQTRCTFATRKKLAVFDLDSTLIQQETIDELAAELGLQEPVARITARAMNGELDFRAALSERVALLKGLHVSGLEAVIARVKYTPGAARLITFLHKIGCTTAVVSGGFDFLANHVRDALGLDFSFANSLEVCQEDCLLTGRIVGDIVDAEFKRRTLLDLARREGLSKDAILAVGDGFNDLLMMQCAGSGVAFNAKPVVQKQAQLRLNQLSLMKVVHLLGYSDDDVRTLLDEK